MEEKEETEIILETGNGADRTTCKNAIMFAPTKLTSYFYFGAKYLLMTYLVPYFISIGLHPAQAGVIISVRYFVQVIGGIILSSLADRSNKHTFIALLAICVTTFSMIAMPIIPYVYQVSNSTEQESVPNVYFRKNGDVEHTFSETKYSKSFLENNTIHFNQSHQVNDKNSTLSLHNDNDTLKMLSPNFSYTSNVFSYLEKSKILSQKYIYSTQKIFYIAMGFSLLYAFFDGSLNGLVDVATISYCDYYGDKSSYYWQRLWGSIGYATMPLFGGIVLDMWIYDNKSFEFIPIFYLFYLLQFVLFCSFIFVLKGFSKIKTKENAVTERKQKTTVQIIKETLKNSKIIICLLLQIVFGIGTGIEFSYLLLYMEDHLVSGSKSILGFSVLSQCIIEAIFSPLMAKITKVITDPFVCMAIGLTGYAIGFLCYYFATSGIQIIFINFIYGISYLLFNFPAQTECYRLCPKRYQTVLFSLSASCYTGIGCAIGGLLGGVLYEKSGPRITYLFTSLLFQISAVFLFFYCIVRYKSKSTGVEEVETPMVI